MPFLILMTKITSIPPWPHGYDPAAKACPVTAMILSRKHSQPGYAAIAKGLPVKAMWQIANALVIVKSAFYCS